MGRATSLTGVAMAVLLAACTGMPRPVTTPRPSAPPSVFTVPNPYALPGARDRPQVQVGRTVVFGDSYSNAVRKGLDGWPTLLQRKGVSRSVEVYALGGATAGGSRPRDLAVQVARFEAEHRRFGEGDLAVVYMGYNDVKDGLDLRASWATYAHLADRLVGLGATAGGRRLFLALLHDWSRNPGVAPGLRPGLRSRVLTWNDLVRDYAAAREGVVAADLFTVFEQIFTDPEAYGFTNVWTPDPTRTAAMALFWDADHFGQRGYGLIAEIYRHHLTWGWDRDDAPTGGPSRSHAAGGSGRSGCFPHSAAVTALRRPIRHSWRTITARGVPLGLALAGANRNDHRLMRDTLEAILVERPVPTPEQPHGLCLDKGYDYDEPRALAQE